MSPLGGALNIVCFIHLGWAALCSDCLGPPKVLRGFPLARATGHMGKWLVQKLHAMDTVSLGCSPEEMIRNDS